MKYFFIVHSNITFLVSKYLIERYNYPVENIMFFTHRNYNLPESRFNTIELPSQIEISRDFLRNWTLIRGYKKIVNQFCKFKYILYTPHTSDIRFALLAINKNCKYFSYIEEGTISYKASSFKYKILSLKDYFKSWILLGNRELVYLTVKCSFYDIKHVKLYKYYALSEFSFQNFPEKRLLLDFNSQRQKNNSEFDCIIFFDACSIYKYVTLDFLLNLFHNVLIPHIQTNGNRKIAYKFHPEHFNSDVGVHESIVLRDEILKYFTDAVEIGADFRTEQYFMDHYVNVYSFVSSVGLYAALLGNKSYNLLNYMKHMSPYIEFSDIQSRNYIYL